MRIEEKNEAALLVLLDLAIKIQTGEAVVEAIEQVKQYVCIHDPDIDQQVYFNTLPMRLYLIYRTPKSLAEEEARLERYLRDHPGVQVRNLTNS